MTRVSPLGIGVGVLLLAAAVVFLVVAAPYISGGRAHEESVRTSTRGIWPTIQRGNIERIEADIRRLEAQIERPPAPSRLRAREERKAGRTQEQIDEILRADHEAEIASIREERDSLIAQRDEIIAELEKPAPSRSFFDILGDFNLILAAVPFFVLGVYVMRISFAARLPDRNPAGLDPRTRRSLIFVTACLIFAFVIVAVGGNLLYLL